MTTQIVEAATSKSWFETVDLGRDPLQARARPVVHDVGHRRRPAEAVSGLVSALRRVDDRRDHAVDDLVRHDEHEHRLRKEARLEDATAVLVRDAALATVTDRLDHRHADVARRILDRIDHRLDPFSDHDCFDFLHR